jgi:hypothetical protein
MNSHLLGVDMPSFNCLIPSIPWLKHSAFASLHSSRLVASLWWSG